MQEVVLWLVSLTSPLFIKVGPGVTINTTFRGRGPSVSLSGFGGWRSHAPL